MAGSPTRSASRSPRRRPGRSPPPSPTAGRTRARSTGSPRPGKKTRRAAPAAGPVRRADPCGE
eukprot:14819590-Alexandrium_andersonii.AAC.1